MKTRGGFVSNSSTSSFVLLGVADPSEDILKQFEELQTAYYEGDTKTRYSVDSEDGRFAGVILGSVGDGDMADVSLAEIAKMAPGVAALLGVEIDDLKILGVEVMS